MYCKCLKCLLSKYNDKKHRYKTVKCHALEYEVKALKVRRHLDVSNKLYENCMKIIHQSIKGCMIKHVKEI